ncbi:MAG: hypothetical protein WBA12_04770 [Catalinimonas sp.]
MLTGQDGESGVQYLAYALNDQPGETRYAEPFRVAQHGPHRLVTFGYDNVNNRNRSEGTFLVDATPPEISENFSIGTTAAGAYLPSVTIFLSATDQDPGIKGAFYRIDGGPERAYAGSGGGFKPGRSYQVTVRAVDGVDNEATKTIRFDTAE